MKKKLIAFLTAIMLLSVLSTAAAAYVTRDDEGNISYVPTEQGVYSNGGYTIDKISHPTLGSGEIDGILTGEDQDRGNTYSWSMADGGDDSDYIYIGTGYNSTFFIFQNNVKTSLQNMQKEGTLDENIDADQVATDIV